ncbi:MAG: plasma-membrane proton-efflux P-type ATPase [Candidatus Aminicenantes bacterium]
MGTKEAGKIDHKTLFKRLSTCAEGLTDAEAKERFKQVGPNEITEKKVNPVLKLLGYFWGPIPWMIEAAAVLSLLIHHLEDFWIIMALLLLNAGVAFWQEYKAGNAIEALKQRLVLETKVLRNNQWKIVPSRELVPGDIINLRLGDIIPADVKLINGDYLLVDESSLTGESLPVEKHSEDIGYAGAVVRQGEMRGLVITTGMKTFFGKTARLVEDTGTQSHFQKAVVKIGDYLILMAVFLVVIIFIVAFFRHESIPETLQFALVLTVAAIPVALPAVLSVTMAVGASRLAKKEAIVSKLVAIEEMAGMDVLCSDKTGTITKNEITVAEVVPLEGFTETDVLINGALASKEEDRDPIDNAILAKAAESKLTDQVSDHYKVIKFQPFDPVSKRTVATVEGSPGEQFDVSKGAPQSILDLLDDPGAIRDKIKQRVDAFAAKGHRALAVARETKKQQWQLTGLIALYDPAREDSEETIKKAQEMNVKVKMVTGDHAAIAKEIAKETHLGTNIVEPAAFLDKPDRESGKIVEDSDGFAQVFPEHKYHIVELLQARGHIVGMTGDGVNDAPALKKADVGIAVTGATDAARSAADIVLTKPGLSVIIDAIEQSRKIFQRMNNYAVYRITETIRVLLFITISILVFRFYPVTALMIVLLALLNDAPIMTIAFDHVKYSQKPERWNMRTVLGIATFLGIIGVISSFLMLYIGRDVLHLSREVLQSFIYLKLSVAGHLTVFVARTKGPFWSIKPSRPVLFAVIATQIIATLIVVYGFLLPAMSWKLALFVWGYALAAFLITDFLKVRLYRLLDHSKVKFHR